jgi:hypothetical protein
MAQSNVIEDEQFVKSLIRFAKVLESLRPTAAPLNCSMESVRDFTLRTVPVVQLWRIAGRFEIS